MCSISWGPLAVAIIIIVMGLTSRGASASASPACVKKKEDKSDSTFYRRELPLTCVAFSSVKGRALFEKALEKRLAEPYFVLAEQFRTQDEPAYCGLATLVMVLNALAIDPGRVWKGVWRWFDEDMLSCCKSLDVVKEEGISLEEFARLARCNGASCSVTRGPSVTLEEFRATIQEHMSGKSRDDEGVVSSFLCLNYNRGALGQTGTGHFSPLCAYDDETDMCLILYVARFKYPPHWVQVAMLHKAIQERGYAVLTPGKRKDGGGPALGCDKCVIEGYDSQGRSICAGNCAHK